MTPLDRLTDHIAELGEKIALADLPEIELLTTQLGEDGFELSARVFEGLSLTVQSPDYKGDIPGDYFEYND